MALSPPSSVGLNGVLITDTPVTGEVLTATGTGTAAWATATGGIVTLFDSGAFAGGGATIDTGAAGIASGYRILEVTIIARTTEAAVGSSLAVTVNNDTGGNYDLTFVRNVNATPAGGNTLAGANWLLPCFGASALANAVTTHRIYLPLYAGTTFAKHGEVTSSQVEDTAADARVQLAALGYRSTTAISRMAITAGSGNLVAGSQLIITGRVV